MILTKFYHNHKVKLAKAVVVGVDLEICVHFYSYETSKTYGYLISPMKMRAF